MMNLEKFEKGQSFSEEKTFSPELLAPVANVEMLKAAIHNGADAVYIGMPGHNARARTEDMSFDQLYEMIQIAHLHDVKVHIAFNILIFEDELIGLEEELKHLLKLKPDALIIQDLGLCYLIRKMAPEQVIHASTQMTHTNHRSIELVEDLDLKRFVLGREVNIDEMKHIRVKTKRELEVFVHGALCVAYSGQCLTSESMGGRSANRGQCAQSCRVDYDLIVDGKLKPLKGIKNLVSPKDLCGLDDIPTLAKLGIDSFKIEGRYKSPEYVGLTSKMYRKKIDGLKTDDSKQDLEIMFSRGFYSGWLHGVHHKNLVHGRSSSHQGSEIGRVTKIKTKKSAHLIVAHSVPIYRGDGLLICDQNDNAVSSGKAYLVKSINDQETLIEFSNKVSLDRVKVGHRVFINSSDHRDQIIQKSWKDKQNHKKVLLDCNIIGQLGEYLSLEVICQNKKAKFYSTKILETAQKKSLLKEDILKEMNKLGGSVYQLNKTHISLDEMVFLHAKEIKQLRQAMIEWLDKERLVKEEVLNDYSFKNILQVVTPLSIDQEQPKLHVVIREPEQLNDLDPTLVQKVTLDFKHGVAYGPTIKRVKALGCEIGIATTRILKEGQERRLNDLIKHQPDYILVRNLGALHFIKSKPELKSIPIIGDFSLNSTNHLSSHYLFSKGINILCPSYDLNKQQLFSLLDHCTPSRYEITVHQYMPSFHMEHCVFATFLSDGTNASNCGMVCRDHAVSLKDAKGVEHPLQADQECRNTMFNGKAQSAANLIPELLDLGVHNFRIEALTEKPHELAQKCREYKKVMEGHQTPDQLKSVLGLEEKYGISEGQLLNNRVYKDRKK